MSERKRSDHEERPAGKGQGEKIAFHDSHVVRKHPRVRLRSRSAHTGSISMATTSTRRFARAVVISPRPAPSSMTSLRGVSPLRQRCGQRFRDEGNSDRGVVVARRAVSAEGRTRKVTMMGIPVLYCRRWLAARRSADPPKRPRHRRLILFPTRTAPEMSV
jgi:hypothetical protein